ncbi:hypothetical protein ACE38V_02980 [Cytobacillus sp. Hz8]|uniref:hypothetical protein n=1 Tax=Cytobacillus sp. Hz8 TaxID=3347168 RepID=UPI0035DB8838
MKYLFENPFIIIVIIGIISSLFKKEKDQKKKAPIKGRSSRQTKAFPTQKSWQTPRSNGNPFNKPLMRSEMPEQQHREIKPFEQKRTIESSMNDLASQYEEVKQEAISQIEELNKQKAQMEQQVAKIKAINVEKKSNSINQAKLENKLRDAVIWSEILGPPRAKKSHRSFTRNP